jgi:PmbA protein
MIERALELARQKAQAAEISLSNRRSAHVEYEDDKLKQASSSQSSSLHVRVIVNGRLGTTRGTSTDDAEKLVARAIELAEFGSDAPFTLPGPADAPQVKLYDPTVEETTLEEMVTTGAEMLDMVKSFNPEIKVGAGASWSAGVTRLINTSGLDITERGSSYGVGVGGTLVRGTDMLFVHQGKGWRTKSASPRDQAERAIEQFRLAEQNVQVETKSMPVIFTSRGAHILLASILMGVSGKNVLKGDSPLSGRIGETLAVSNFSLIDDATIDFAPGSGSHDGEGVPTSRFEIVKDGVLQGFLYDLDTAAKAGTKSTGHGPGCGTSNLIVPGGSMTLAEMIANTKEGVVIDGVLGFGSSNLMNGDFSCNIALGFKIENGELVGRVKDTMVAGNLYDALKQIDVIGSESEWHGSTCMPPVRVDALSIVAKA